MVEYSYQKVRGAPVKQRILLFLLAFSLVLSCLPGCGQEKNLFHLSGREVTRIRLQDGTTGEYADFESSELQKMLGFLNSVTYENVTSAETAETGGWSWRLVVYGSNGTASYRFEADWIEVENVRYRVGRETVNTLIEMFEVKIK